MALYCTCSRFLSEYDDTVKPNELRDHDSQQSVVLRTAIRCIKTGAEQFLPDGRQHYPSVDLFACPRCLTIVARE
jgi:hypothetical protein